MERLVVALMVLVCFSFLLKQTVCRYRVTIAMAAVCALFTGLMWPYAINQSKTQITGWIADPSLMLSLAVLLSVDVFLQMAYCVLYVQVETGKSRKRGKVRLYRLLHFYPGLLIFPVLFSLLVVLIFSLPGVSFPLIAWCFAALVLIAVPLGRLVLERLLSDEEERMEWLFLVNAVIAVLGVIATVNGRTAAAGTAAVNLGALSGVAFLAVLGTAAGMLQWKIRLRRQSKKNQKLF